MSEIECTWRDDARLVDALAAGDGTVEAARHHRAACLGLVPRASTALLAMVGGRVMGLGLRDRWQAGSRS